MRINKFLRKGLLGLMLIPTFAFCTNNPPLVMITGDIVNNTQYPWGPTLNSNFYFASNIAQVYTAIDPNAVPSKGRFIFILPVGGVDTIYLNTSGKLPFADICELKVTVIDKTHAVITKIGGSNTKAVTCTYSGDPSNNTAAIILNPGDKTK